MNSHYKDKTDNCLIITKWSSIQIFNIWLFPEYQLNQVLRLLRKQLGAKSWWTTISTNDKPIFQWVVCVTVAKWCSKWNTIQPPWNQNMTYNVKSHDDVIKWNHFPRYWPFVRGIHRSPVNSPHKGQWHGALMFSLICVWINGWVNNLKAGD